MNLILYSAVETGDKASEDTLDQARFIAEELSALGMSLSMIPVGGESKEPLKDFEELLKDMQPSFVFNLIESWDGSDAHAWMPLEVLESLRIPYTGNRSFAFKRCADKEELNKELISWGLNVPKPWDQEQSGLFLIKSAKEHASFGLHDEHIVESQHVKDVIAQQEKRYGSGFFAEKYIDGREFNISLFEDEATSLVIFPPAEIDFSNYADGKPKIVGHMAKWEKDCFEYFNSDRSFHFNDFDKPLLEELKAISKKCWENLRLSGYARIDFRVDAKNKPFIIDINVNPCLSPDAGFLAAAKRAGLTPSQVFEKLIKNCKTADPACRLPS